MTKVTKKAKVKKPKEDKIDIKDAEAYEYPQHEPLNVKVLLKTETFAVVSCSELVYYMNGDGFRLL